MKRKQFITFVLTALLSIVGARALAHDIEVANADGVTIYYKWANNQTELSVSYGGSYYTDYSDRYTGNVIIPESATYNGTTYPVTSIGGGAFYKCSGLTSVTIPISVTSIGDDAFMFCSGLTTVTIPNSVTSIGKLAFSDCSGLTSITIPNSVTSIGQLAFSGSSGLTSVTIPNSVTSIGQSAFFDCKGLTSVTIGNSVTSIDKGTFLGCSGLTSVTIPNSVTSIGQYAFQWCSGLTSVTIGNSVTSIDPSAFSNCPNLQNAMVSSSLEKIIADKRIPLFSGTKIKTVTVKNPNGTKKQSNAWYWFDNESPKERAEAAKRAAELARQEAEARKSIDPNSMSWPEPSYDSGWQRFDNESLKKYVSWTNQYRNQISILVTYPYDEVLRAYYIGELDWSYKNYQDAEAAAYFWKVHGLKRTRGVKRKYSH